MKSSSKRTGSVKGSVVFTLIFVVFFCCCVYILFLVEIERASKRKRKEGKVIEWNDREWSIFCRCDIFLIRQTFCFFFVVCLSVH